MFVKGVFSFCEGYSQNIRVDFDGCAKGIRKVLARLWEGDFILARKVFAKFRLSPGKGIFHHYAKGVRKV